MLATTGMHERVIGNTTVSTWASRDVATQNGIGNDNDITSHPHFSTIVENVLQEQRRAALRRQHTYSDSHRGHKDLELNPVEQRSEWRIHAR